jgi:hypothetical protein
MSTKELVQIALFGAIGFVFYFLTAPLIDSFLPLMGCLIRPMIFLFFISSQFHLNRRQLVYVSLISSFIYALVIPCFVNAASVPVSLIFVWIVLSSRKFLHPIWISIIASISAFAGLVILAFFFSQTKTDYINILKGFPIILGLALILGLYRMKFGKINCFGCDLCDSPGYSHYMKRTLINHKDPISKEQQKK